jgi:polysaccharide biosynthesis protein PslG
MRRRRPDSLGPTLMSLIRPLLLLALGAVALVLTLGLRGAEEAGAAQPGLVPDLTWYTSDVDKVRTIAAIEDVGSEWVRLNVQWKEAEPTKGAYNEWWIAEYQKAVAMADAAGQSIIVMVDTAPSWASGSGSSNVPREPGDYAAFMKYLSGRLGPAVDAYEVWNEPNLKRFWSTGPNAAEYTRLLRAAYPAIKAGNPAAKVVFAGVSGNDYVFLEQAYDAGAKGYFDVMATHPYPYCGSTGPADVRRSNGRISVDSFTGYREVRATMAARGDVKPIWVTEFGWNTSSTKCDPGAGMWQGGVTEAKQAEYLYEAFELLERDPYVEVALWYDFRNNYWMKDENAPEAQYGLLRTDFTPKPAYYAYRDYAHGRPLGGGGQPPLPVDAVKPAITLKVKRGKDRSRPKVRGRMRVGILDGSSAARSIDLDQPLSLDLEIERRRGSRWVPQAVREVSLRGARFRSRLGGLPRGKLRARATFEGAAGLASASSRFVAFRVR